MERGNEMRCAFKAKTHYPGARFSVHPWWRRAPGKGVFVALNPEGISETRAPYYNWMESYCQIGKNQKTNFHKNDLLSSKYSPTSILHSDYL